MIEISEAKPAEQSLITGGLFTIATRNLTVMTEFYTSLLGYQPWQVHPLRYVEYRLPDFRLGLFRPTSDHEAEFLAASASPGAVSLCLCVGDLASAIAQLVALGYPPRTEIQEAAHGQEIYAYDPDGNRLILYQPRLEAVQG